MPKNRENDSVSSLTYHDSYLLPSPYSTIKIYHNRHHLVLKLGLLNH